MLTRTAILRQTEMKTVKVNIPEWGGSVNIKEWTASERAEFEFASTEKNKDVKDETDRIRFMREVAAVHSVEDEKGNRMFTDADVDQLSKLSGSALDRLFDAIAKLNHIGADDQEKLVKN